MNTYLKISLILTCFFISGILFFAYQESWIIINIPQTSIWKNLQNPKNTTINCYLWAFKNNQWIKEEKQINKTEDTAQMIQSLLNNWFLFLQEEHILRKTITVDSCILSPTKKLAFISLNHNPFNSQATTYECLILIEGCLKTIRENKIELQDIQILLNHKPWTDHRLNMEIPWPITGYMNN
jgi:hypothetical protein